MADAGELEGFRRLSGLAFDELSRRDLSSASGPPPADLPTLLRLCLLSLPLSADAELALRRCTRLLASLRGILCRDLDPSLLPALEVFLDNLVSSNQLMTCFTAANAVMPRRSRITSLGSVCSGGNLFVMELMSHHFISSVQDEEGFLSALSWSAKAKLEVPEIGLSGALSLLHKSCLLSIPPAVQAHFLLLACRCADNGDLNMNLLAFEHAMDVYLSYLPALGVFRRTSGVKRPLGCSMKRRPLSSCLQAATHQKLACDINRLVLFCNLHSNDDLPINESDIVRFIEENQQVLHEQSRQDTITAVKSIVSNVLLLAKQEEMDRLYRNVSEEIICLAAALRLMGSSFIRIMHCIRQMTVGDGSQTTHCLEPCKVFNIVSETISLLGHYEPNELQRNDLFDTIGCIFMMMMANLCATEMYHFLIDGSKASKVRCADQDGSLKASVPRKSSTVIALRFQNTQQVYIQDKLGPGFGEVCSLVCKIGWTLLVGYSDVNEGQLKGIPMALPRRQGWYLLRPQARNADDLPAPDKVVQLIQQQSLKYARIYDTNIDVIKAFANTGVELMVGVPNSDLLPFAPFSMRTRNRELNLRGTGGCSSLTKALYTV
ncbi:hypothetical protein OsI_07118 [Oryza sativa Indica Group]|uniref:DUF7812 domain-containing protein n=1 Tax=Oryza sativa subsp. indica TaxID=39946 RepID=A2X4K0_ORYSI|nr:hypothetical protein OsI_07118 [Oryza sativa Indica Group]